MIDQEDKLFERVQREYYANQERLFSSSQELHKQWDTQTISLSAAALALTITLIDTTIDVKEASFLLLLYLSWIGFCVAILFTYISYYYASKGEVYIKKLLEDTYNHHADQNLSVNKLAVEADEIRLNAKDPKDAVDKIARRRLLIQQKTVEFNSEAEPLKNKVNDIGDTIRGLNNARSIAFVLAFILLTIFSIINI